MSSTKRTAAVEVQVADILAATNGRKTVALKLLPPEETVCVKADGTKVPLDVVAHVILMGRTPTGALVLLKEAGMDVWVERDEKPTRTTPGGLSEADVLELFALNKGDALFEIGRPPVGNDPGCGMLGFGMAELKEDVEINILPDGRIFPIAGSEGRKARAEERRAAVYMSEVKEARAQAAQAIFAKLGLGA